VSKMSGVLSADWGHQKAHPKRSWVKDTPKTLPYQQANTAGSGGPGHRKFLHASHGLLEGPEALPCIVFVLSLVASTWRNEKKDRSGGAVSRFPEHS
jgi:hypothetical protein